MPTGSTPDRRPPALAIRGISKTFAGTAALTELDLDLPAGEVPALLGENGSGKSTLIKILSGYHRPDPGGQIRVGGQLLDPGSAEAAYARGCRFVHQDLGLIETSSIADNLALNAGFPKRFGTVREGDLARTARQDLARVGLDLDPRVLVGALSPAERTGVAVARALHEDPHTTVSLLVLDEPTATLPEPEVERLLEIVRTVAAAGVGVLYVTHRLEEVFLVADTITVLRDGHRVAQVPVSSLDRSQLITLLIGTELEEVSSETAELDHVTTEPLLTVEDLWSAGLCGVDLQIAPGDIVGVAGIIGSGRESLLSTLFGAAPRLRGRVLLDGTPLPTMRPDKAMRSGVAFLPADRKTNGGFFELTTRENLSISDLRPFWRWPLISRRREKAEAAVWVERLGVRPGTAAEAPLRSLSGGNQQKVLFAKWLRRAPRLLLLDEPTQGVDIGAKAEIHHEVVAAARTGTAVLVSSSDTDELAALCHRVLVLREGRVAAHLTGSRVTATEISHACLGAHDRSPA
jgi:ribose transport system ATP-binding protein